MPRGPSFSERPTRPAPARKSDAPGSSGPHAATDGSRLTELAGRNAPPPRESGKLAIAERRSSVRVRIELDVSLGAEAHYFTAASFDLSPGGLFVATYRALAIGTELAVEFDLPASRVVAKGRVRWAREATNGEAPGYGIAFEDLSKFDRTLIESFCASRDDGSATADDSGDGRSAAQPGQHREERALAG